MELVYLLNEEGYGVLAGELLTEIALGYEIGQDDEELETISSGHEPTARPEESQRQPIPQDLQLEFAVNFLELRLVAPMRFLAEAEVLAGKLSTPPEGEARLGEKLKKATGPIRVAFMSPADRSEARIERAEAPGSYKSIDALSSALKSLTTLEG